MQRIISKSNGVYRFAWKKLGSTTSHIKIEYVFKYVKKIHDNYFNVLLLNHQLFYVTTIQCLLSLSPRWNVECIMTNGMLIRGICITSITKF